LREPIGDMNNERSAIETKLRPRLFRRVDDLLEALLEIGNRKIGPPFGQQPG
jgi:hypothetical protein